MKKKGWGTFVPRECYLQRAIAVSSAATLPISLAAAFISAAFSLGLNPFFFFPIGVPSFLSARSTPCGALRASRLRVRLSGCASRTRSGRAIPAQGPEQSGHVPWTDCPCTSSTLGSLRSPFPLLMVLLYHTACSMSTLLKTFLSFLQNQSTHE